MTQKDRDEARRRRDEAIARGYSAADEKFKRHLDDAIANYALICAMA